MESEQQPVIDNDYKSHKVAIICLTIMFTCFAFARMSEVLVDDPSKTKPIDFLIPMIPVPSDTFYLAAAHFYACNIFYGITNIFIIVIMLILNGLNGVLSSLYSFSFH